MAIYHGSKVKLFLGSQKIKKGYLGASKIYSSGNIVTYVVDSDLSYQEEVEEGESILSPKCFTPAKSGWKFVGWRSDATTNANVYTSYIMGDNPVTLYAVFAQTVTLSTIANGVNSSQSKNRVYNNGNIANPVFTVSNPIKSGASFLGWSSSAGSTAISNSAITNLSLLNSTTRYAVFKYPDVAVITSPTYKSVRADATILYDLDTTKYPIHNITATVGEWNMANSSSGMVYGLAFIDGVVVRARRRDGANTPSDYYETWGNPVQYPGTNGQAFTLTNKHGQPTYSYSGQGPIGNISITITNLTAIGATVVG